MTDAASSGKDESCAVHAGSSRNETNVLKSSQEDIRMTGIGSGFMAKTEQPLTSFGHCLLALGEIQPYIPELRFVEKI